MTKEEFDNIGFTKGMKADINSPFENGVFNIIGVDFEDRMIMINNVCNSWIERRDFTLLK